MTDSPYRAFKEKLCTFADGQAGIRNPFVIAAVDPAVEHQTADRLSVPGRRALVNSRLSMTV